MMNGEKLHFMSISEKIFQDFRISKNDAKEAIDAANFIKEFIQQKLNVKSDKPE